MEARVVAELGTAVPTMSVDEMADHCPEALGHSPTAAWLNFIESIVMTVSCATTTA